MKYLVLLFLFIGCSNKVGTFKSVDSIERIPASIENSLEQCLSEKKVICKKHHDPELVDRNDFSKEYQYYSKKLEILEEQKVCEKHSYNSCLSDLGMASPALQLSTKVYSDELDDSWNEGELREIDFSFSQLKHLISFSKTLLDRSVELKKLSKKISDGAVKYTHGLGAAVDLRAFAGVGIGTRYEMVHHLGKMGLFCAPYASFITDAGVQANLNFVKTMGCGNNKMYQGKFMSFELGISTEIIGIPAGIGASYSIGIDVPKFLAELKTYHNKDEFNLIELVKELGVLSSKAFLESIPVNYRPSLALMVIGQMAYDVSGIQDHFYDMAAYTDAAFKRTPEKNEISKMLRKEKLIKEIEMLELYYGKSFSHLKIFTKGLINHMSKCDALSISIGASLSAIPVSVGISFSEYVNVTEMHMKDLSLLGGYALLGPGAVIAAQFMPKQKARLEEALTRTSRAFYQTLTTPCDKIGVIKQWSDIKDTIDLLK